jgi:hypothetical protein
VSCAEAGPGASITPATSNEGHHPRELRFRLDAGLRHSRLTHRQYRAWRGTDDALGHVAHQQVHHGAVAMRPHHDQIGAVAVGGLDDRGRRNSEQHLGRHRADVPEARRDLDQLPLGFFAELPAPVGVGDGVGVHRRQHRGRHLTHVDQMKGRVELARQGVRIVQGASRIGAEVERNEDARDVGCHGWVLFKTVPTSEKATAVPARAVHFRADVAAPSRAAG